MPAHRTRPSPSTDWALLLDLDGTLIDIARSPMQVLVAPGLIPLLEMLHVLLDGAVGVITGRHIDQVNALLSPFMPPTVGVHGTQIRRSASSPIETLTPDVPPELVARLRTVFEGTPGIVVEEKGAVVAVHYRLAPQDRDKIEAVLQELIADAKCSLVLSHGRMVFELVPLGFSKGSGVRALYELPIFAGRRPIMIGDDVSDEAGFDAVAQLGGFGLKVAGEHFPDSISDFTGPQDVRDWLASVTQTLTERNKLETTARQNIR